MHDPLDIFISADSIWGVVDIVPETDFPDLRDWAIIQSNHGTLMNIPREGDMVRFYIQLPEDTDLVNRETGRVDTAKANAERIIESAAKIMVPFSLSVVDKAEWWTVYISAWGAVRVLRIEKRADRGFVVCSSIVGQRIAETYSVRDRVFIAGDACHTHSPKAGTLPRMISVRQSQNVH